MVIYFLTDRVIFPVYTPKNIIIDGTINNGVIFEHGDANNGYL